MFHVHMDRDYGIPGSIYLDPVKPSQGRAGSEMDLRLRFHAESPDATGTFSNRVAPRDLGVYEISNNVKHQITDSNLTYFMIAGWDQRPRDSYLHSRAQAMKDWEFSRPSRIAQEFMTE
jgi:hypothetical protein